MSDRVETRVPLLTTDFVSSGHYTASGRGFQVATAPGFHLTLQYQGVAQSHTRDGTEPIVPGGVRIFRRGRTYRTGDSLGSESRAFVITLHEAALESAPRLSALVRDEDAPEAIFSPPGLSIRVRAMVARASADAMPCALDEAVLALEAHLETQRNGRWRDRHGSPKTRRHHREFVAHALEMLARAPDRPWSLESLAREVHSSPFHLARLIRTATQRSVSELLTVLRLEKAADMLARHHGTIDQIALHCGYAHRGRLEVLFRRHLGVSPSAYRTAHRGGVGRFPKKLLHAHPDVLEC